MSSFMVVTERYKALAIESRDACRHPGKFEGCAPYVAYFWGLYLEGCADRDDGVIIGFDLTSEDKELFPELKERRTVNIASDNQGFVVEVW